MLSCYGHSAHGTLDANCATCIAAEIFKAAPPLRSRFKPLAGHNKRDVARWMAAETVQAFVGATGNPGSADFHVEWTDGPDRYTLNAALDPRAGWRR